jgi:hypothetical protein
MIAESGRLKCQAFYNGGIGAQELAPEKNHEVEVEVRQSECRKPSFIGENAVASTQANFHLISQPKIDGSL